MIWPYAICEAREAPPAPLEAVREGALMAVFGREEPEALWEHERVVERLMDGGALLPMRFGSSVEDEDELRAVLRERHDRLTGALARIGDRVELGVRVLGTATEAPTTGRDYLQARLSVSRLDAALAELAAESRRRPPRRGELLRAAYLVDPADVPRFRAAAGDAVCTGPWPPYSFVGDA
jgi:hypothetical protein